jgi:hypothetical protein
MGIKVVITVSHPTDHYPIGPDKETLLHAVIAELIRDFGLGPVKQEINRPPRPRNHGRPKVWDEIRLFSLWLIVQTLALKGNHKINSACRLLEKLTGGLTMYPENGSSVLLGRAQIIRKQFYKADAELDKYEARHRGDMTPTSTPYITLRERLQRHAEILSKHEPFFADSDEITSGIVALELSDDDTGNAGDVRYVLIEESIGSPEKTANPPISPPDRSELEGKIAHLKARFGESVVKDLIKRFPERKRPGRPKMWYDLRLFTVWLLVQHIAQGVGANIDHACKIIEQMGGIFEFMDDDEGLRSRVASKQAQIRQLYYDAEKAFIKFERTVRSKFVNDNCKLTLKEQLLRIAKEIGNRKIIIAPILSFAMIFVLRCLREDGICTNHLLEFPNTSTNMKLAQMHFAPDGHGRWFMKRAPPSADGPFLSEQEWDRIFGVALERHQTGKSNELGATQKT